jgi:hypothetical protein
MESAYDYDERVEVWSQSPHQLEGYIARHTLSQMGLHVHSNKTTATRFQLMAFKQQPTWKDAK